MPLPQLQLTFVGPKQGEVLRTNDKCVKLNARQSVYLLYADFILAFIIFCRVQRLEDRSFNFIVLEQ